MAAVVVLHGFDQLFMFIGSWEGGKSFRVVITNLLGSHYKIHTFSRPCIDILCFCNSRAVFSDFAVVHYIT